MKFVFVALLALCGMSMAHQLGCSPEGKPGHLFGADVNGKDLEVYQFSDERKVNGHLGLVRAKNTSQTFQFYRCAAPFGKYKSGGQIRSVQNKTLCVTPGAVNIYHTNFTSTQYPEDADPRISLQPCATSHSLELRKQWFSNSATPKKCIEQMTLQGWKTDAPSDTIVMSENGVVLGTHVMNSTIQELFLGPSDGFNNTCA